MATTMLPIRPVGVMACASSGHRKPDVNSQRASSSNWWSPLFGWSAEPDYIDTDNKRNALKVESQKLEAAVDQEDPKAPARLRVARGSLTAEKARQLRKMTTESSTFHDVMYHSAIASRLASDFSDR